MPLHDFEFWQDVMIHLALEGVGGLITYWALSFCTHAWHRIAWMAGFGLLTSALMVGVVG